MNAQNTYVQFKNNYKACAWVNKYSKLLASKKVPVSLSRHNATTPISKNDDDDEIWFIICRALNIVRGMNVLEIT